MSLSEKLSLKIQNSNEFFMEYLVMLEGIQVQCNSISVSYGIDTPPTCTLVLPASNLIRDLPENTKIHIFFRDLLPNSEGKHEWRLLFDGEFSGWSYNTDPSSATISINGIHATLHLNLMQLITLDIAQFLYFNANSIVGQAVIPSLNGKNGIQTTIIKNLLSAKCYESMVDIAYALVRSVIEATSLTATGKFYKELLGEQPKGLKILRRFFGVSDKAKKAPVATPDFKPGGGSSSSGGGTSSAPRGGGGSTRPYAAGVVYDADGDPTVESSKRLFAANNPGAYDKAKSDQILARARESLGSSEQFGTEGCARAAGYWSGGGYSGAADHMQLQTAAQGGNFTDRSLLQPGDTVYYTNTYGNWPDGTVTHVGVYDGNGSVIHHGTNDVGTSRIPLDSSFTIAGFGRPY